MSIELAETLPHDIEAERAALGAVLVAPEHFAEIAAIVSPVDFHRQGHRDIFSAFRALIERGAPVDFISLKDELTKAGRLDSAGGPAYISALSDGVPRSINAAYCARIIKERASARELIRLFQRATDALVKDPAKIGNGLPAMVREHFDRIVEAANTGPAGAGGLEDTALTDGVHVAEEGRAIDADGVPQLIHGLIPFLGMLGFLVAFAKVGKTTFGQAIALRWAGPFSNA